MSAGCYSKISSGSRGGFVSVETRRGNHLRDAGGPKAREVREGLNSAGNFTWTGLPGLDELGG